MLGLDFVDAQVIIFGKERPCVEGEIIWALFYGPHWLLAILAEVDLLVHDMYFVVVIV